MFEHISITGHSMHHWLAAQARGWLGTRFAHQGRRKRCGSDRGGVDCLGLLIGVAGELDVCIALPGAGVVTAIAELDAPYYGHRPDGGELQSRLAEYLTLCGSTQPMQEGDIALLGWDGNAQHLGIISAFGNEGWGMIHAYAAARRVWWSTGWMPGGRRAWWGAIGYRFYCSFQPIVRGVEVLRVCLLIGCYYNMRLLCCTLRFLRAQE